MSFGDDVRDVSPAMQASAAAARPMFDGGELDELVSVARRLGPDERRVLCLLAHRLFIGAGTYGVLKLGADHRDFRDETADELLDACAYAAMLALKPNRS